MIIKFSDKFESIFYAVLLSNITGNFLISKNDNLGLFINEDFLDIDKLNWQQILQEHNKKYGELKWFNYNQEKFLKFKDFINQELNSYRANKYLKVISNIKQVIKFGLTVCEHKFQIAQGRPKLTTSKFKAQINPLLVFDKRLI